MKKRSSLELAFESYWQQLANDLPAYTSEYVFAPPRRWRFDYCWPDRKIALELEGGSWVGGRHTRGSGFEADAEKYNAAALGHWLVLRYTTTMLKNDPAGCIDQVRQLLQV